MSDLRIFHGPRMAEFKPPNGEKRRPTTWSLGFRAQAPMVDAIELLAKKNGCGVADILRTATAEFLAKYAPAEGDNIGDRLTAHGDAREAQINLGLVPRTSAPHNSVADRRMAFNSNPTQDQPSSQKSSSPTHAPAKRGGMKDKISAL